MNGSNIHFFSQQWPVFYEDNHLLVLYKPAGLLMQGDHTRDISLLEMGKAWIKNRYGKPNRVFLGLVHRLDRPVAGVVLFCRTSKSSKRLSEQFRTHDLKKRYMAIVEGGIPRNAGKLVHHLERHGTTSRVVSTPTASSREAELYYRILDTYKTQSLVEIDLYTGRHHQIRVQLAHLGFPILGDLRYGASGPLPQKQIGLVATQLSITHPTLKTDLTFSCPLPKGWPWPGKGLSREAPIWNWEDYRSKVMSVLETQDIQM